MNQLLSIIWYARDCLKIYQGDYSQTIRVRALDRLLKAFDGKGNYFPLLAPETERHIERESNTQRSRLTDELGMEKTVTMGDLGLTAEKAWQKLDELEPGVLLALQSFLNRDQAETVYPTLEPRNLAQEQTFCACGHELNDHYRGFQFCAQCTCPEFQDEPDPTKEPRRPAGIQVPDGYCTCGHTWDQHNFRGGSFLCTECTCAGFRGA